MSPVVQWASTSSDRIGGDKLNDRAELSAELFGLLALLVHRTSQDAAVRLRAEGLNPAQFQLLRAVRDHPGGTQTELANRFGVTRANASMLISKMVDAGLLQREANGSANRVWLTDVGASVVHRLEPEQAQFFLDRFNTLTDEQLVDLHALALVALAESTTE